MSDIENNYQEVVNRINDIADKHQIDRHSIKLIAVSKTHSIDKIKKIAKLGQLDFGENYLQESIDKIQQLYSLKLNWHFIGSIQSNKTADIAQHFDWVHSVDRLKIARRLNDQRPKEKGKLNVFIQVNIEGEASKSGFSREQLLDSLEQLNSYAMLNIRGLMAIPKEHTDKAKQREVFAKVKELNNQCQKVISSMTELSMGMTNDMDSAIIEGASYIRIGSAIFGARDYS